MRADESDDDFEEVPEKEGFEPHVLDDLRVKHGEFIQVARGRDLQNKINRLLLRSNKGTCSLDGKPTHTPDDLASMHPLLSANVL